MAQQLNVSRVGPTEMKGIVMETWQVGKVPSGGYITALLINHLQRN